MNRTEFLDVAMAVYDDHPAGKKSEFRAAMQALFDELRDSGAVDGLDSDDEDEGDDASDDDEA